MRSAQEKTAEPDIVRFSGQFLKVAQWERLSKLALMPNSRRWIQRREPSVTQEFFFRLARLSLALSRFDGTLCVCWTSECRDLALGRPQVDSDASPCQFTRGEEPGVSFRLMSSAH